MNDQPRYEESHRVKTKIIATIGPAVESEDLLRELVRSGVDVFRLNFAHGTHEWLTEMLTRIQQISAELDQPLATLADLSGPKIRLGSVHEDVVMCVAGEIFTFDEQSDPFDAHSLTCSYESLLDDLSVGDSILLADGTVRMRVQEIHTSPKRAVCIVREGGLLRSRQGINLPGVKLSTPSLTEKDCQDLAWALENEIDFIGLSFVRTAEDIRDLKRRIEQSPGSHTPQVIAKIEKREAIENLEAILDETDAVMVARGDLGVETDIVQLPMLQKHIIRLCNEHRIPVITATQMLDSMQSNERPTRAEASDVANAVLDGSDAVMLSGETAIGDYPVLAVAIMSQIAREAEQSVQIRKHGDSQSEVRTHARIVTEAVTLGASTAAEHLHADLIVVATHSGKTAMAISKQRSPVPLLALTDQAETARRICLYWGVTPHLTNLVKESPERLLKYVVEWGKKNSLLQTGSRLVLVGSTQWSAEGHDLMLVHAVN